MVLMPITDKKQNSLFLKSDVAGIKISSGFYCRGKFSQRVLRGINRNLNFKKLQPLDRGYNILIKSSRSLENKGFIAMCSPYLFI